MGVDESYMDQQEADLRAEVAALQRQVAEDAVEEDAPADAGAEEEDPAAAARRVGAVIQCYGGAGDADAAADEQHADDCGAAAGTPSNEISCTEGGHVAAGAQVDTSLPWKCGSCSFVNEVSPEIRS